MSEDSVALTLSIWNAQIKETERDIEMLSPGIALDMAHHRLDSLTARKAELENQIIIL